MPKANRRCEARVFGRYTSRFEIQKQWIDAVTRAAWCCFNKRAVPSSNMSKATFMERALTHSRTEQLIVLQEYTTVVVIVVATASGGQILETLERWNKTALERNKESIE